MPSLVKFIGISELLGGIGLILPSLLRKWPMLTPIAAIGICLIMIFAVIFHIKMGETKTIGMPILLALIAFFIAWGRMKSAPIAAK
jgi:protein-S-isoprenylcysteine O-methyltransferase Ste14